MIVRALRRDENYKLDAVSSIAFNFSCDMDEAKKGELDEEVIGAFADDDRTLGAVIFPVPANSFYCGSVFPAVGIGGVATLPEFRRGGYIRAIFNEIFRLAPERGWVTSYLYPFSYSYYRQFGYERLNLGKSIKLPLSALDVADRNNEAMLYKSHDQLGSLIDIYNCFAEKYNCMYKRDSEISDWDNYCSPNPHKSKKYTYIWHDSAYASVTVESDEVLKVGEIAYKDVKSLKGILGFLRAFEGQVNEIKFSELPECSEIDYMLKDYSNIEYESFSAGMGRILQVKTLLESNKYPLHNGHFRLKVNDTLDWNNGIFDVEYSNGKANVNFSADGDYDISASIPPLTRIMLGCDDFNAEKASFLTNVKLENNADDFFNAFPKRKVHLYDKF